MKKDEDMEKAGRTHWDLNMNVLQISSNARVKSLAK